MRHAAGQAGSVILTSFWGRIPVVGCSLNQSEGPPPAGFSSLFHAEYRADTLTAAPIFATGIFPL
jgi:hypothetical protein